MPVREGRESMRVRTCACGDGITGGKQMHLQLAAVFSRLADDRHTGLTAMDHGTVWALSGTVSMMLFVAMVDYHEQPATSDAIACVRTNRKQNSKKRVVLVSRCFSVLGISVVFCLCL